MFVENFQIYLVQITGKCICESEKIESKHLYSCTIGKICPHVLNNTPRLREITHPLRQRFFLKICFPPNRKRGGSYEKLSSFLSIQIFSWLFDHLGKQLGKKVEHIFESTIWNVINFFIVCQSRGLPKYVKTKLLTTCLYLT